MSNVIDIESAWMEKIHYQDDHPALIKAAGFRFQFFDGNDRMSKSASAAISRDTADRWKPDSRHFGLHVIAMGSDESVGPNRNGDGWPAQALRDFHPTFTKLGCFFREHKNRCQKTQGIGQIKYAAYNEPMSRVELILWGDKDKAAEEYEMAKAGKELSFSMSARMPYDRCSICDKKSRKQEDYCFVPGTMVTMADATLKPIEDIQEGDSVLDADGLPTRVVATSTRDVDEHVVVMENSLFGGETVVTGNHPFLAMPAEVSTMLPVCNRRESRRLNDLPLSLVAGWEAFTPHPHFVNAGYLRRGDFIVAPALKRNPTLWDGFCDEEDAWVFGLFLAEGSYGKQKKSNGEPTRTSLQFSLHQKEEIFAERLRAYFKDRHNKDLKVYASARSKGVSLRVHSKEVCAAFYEVCGEYAHAKALDVRFLHAPEVIQRALLDGIYSGDGHIYEKEGRPSSSRINVVARNMLTQMWHLLTRDGELSYIGNSLNPLGPQCRVKYPGSTNKTPIWYLASSYMGERGDTNQGKAVMDGRMIGYITRIEHRRYTGPVLNFETESHTYVANGMAVHNCNHLKDNMLRYIPQLKKTAYAVNKDDLKFFDISKVGRRADRVATYIRYMFGDDMAKAASFGDRIITGADWAVMEFAGKRGLGSDMLRMFAPWESATLEKLAAAEAELRETGPEHLVAIRRGAPAGIPQSAILAFAAQDLPSIGGELAKRAMLLDFKSFSSLVSGLSLEDLDSDNGFRKVAMDELPGIFGSMMAAGGCECGDAASLVAPDEFGCALSQDKDMIDNIIHEVGDNLGMEDGRMVSRAAKSMDKAASAQVRTPAGDGGDVAFFRGMLNAYGYYAVKAAYIAQGVAGASPHILLRAVPAMNQSIG